MTVFPNCIVNVTYISTGAEGEIKGNLPMGLVRASRNSVSSDLNINRDPIFRIEGNRSL